MAVGSGEAVDELAGNTDEHRGEPGSQHGPDLSQCEAAVGGPANATRQTRRGQGTQRGVAGERGQGRRSGRSGRSEGGDPELPTSAATTSPGSRLSWNSRPTLKATMTPMSRPADREAFFAGSIGVVDSDVQAD